MMNIFCGYINTAALVKNNTGKGKGERWP